MLARTRWADPFDILSNDMGAWFGRLLPAGLDTLLPGRTGAYPRVNLWDADDDVVLEAELPGVKIDDLEVFTEGRELTLKGRRRATGPVTEGAAEEPTDATFARTVRLPVDVEPDGVTAKLCDGVLTVTLPKAGSARPRQIQIKS